MDVVREDAGMDLRLSVEQMLDKCGIAQQDGQLAVF